MTDLSDLPDLLRAKNWPRAEALLRRAAKSKSVSAEVFYNLDKVLEAAGKHAQREVWLKRAVSKAPDYANAWFELGRVAIDNGDLKLARNAFTKAVELAPDDRDARRTLGRVALRFCDWTTAEKAFAEGQDTEARMARFRIAAETGNLTREERDALLADVSIRPDVLRTMTRVAKGSLPLRL